MSDHRPPASNVATASVAAGLGVAGAALHAITLRGEFVWDDVAYRQEWAPRMGSLKELFAPSSMPMTNRSRRLVSIR